MANIEDKEKAAYNRRISDIVEDGKDYKSIGRAYNDARMAPAMPRMRRGSPGPTQESPAAKRDLARGGYDAMLGVNPEETGYRKGGIVRPYSGGRMGGKVLNSTSHKKPGC